MVCIYHNPRCSKSRQALELIRQNSINPEVVLYLQTALDRAQILELLDKLGMGPRQLLRSNEAEFRELGLADNSLGDDQLIDAMVSHPKLIQRPIVVNGDRAVIGRPPEAVLDIL